MARLGLACGLATLSLIGTGPGSPLDPPEQPMLRHPAPSFRLKDLSGKALALEDLRGRFIVLHFTASW
jgi:cytochrome oxidase Cu insertion factor (SCO1/SenC/PrrC family)